MSGDETFLARWARRKQAVREAEPSSPSWGEAETQQSVELGEEAVTDADAPSPHLESEQPLPGIEDLDAASDITAFLRKGVPDALRQAALRKVWALDPAIRDFVSPAEYAWDFNDPNSIPGFSSSVGTLDLTGFFSGEPAGVPVPPPSTSTAEGDHEEHGGGGDPEPQHLPPGASAASPLVSDRALPKDLNAAASGNPSPSAAETPSSESSDTLPRRHGGALPR